MTNNFQGNADDFAGGQRSPEFVAEILEGDAGYESVRKDWQVLADGVEGALWACQPQVYWVWSQLMRADAPPKIIAVRNENGELRGIMPIMQDFAWRGPSCAPRYDYDPADRSMLRNRKPRFFPVRQLATMASLPATMFWLGALASAEESERVCRAIAKAILNIPKWDVTIILTAVGLDQQHWLAAFQGCGATAFTHELGRNVQGIRNLEPFDAIVARQKKKFRQNVRRAFASAAAEKVSFSVHEGAEAMNAHMKDVAELAGASWKHLGRADQDVHMQYEGNQQLFFEKLFALEKLDCVPVVGIAKDADGPIAMQIMIRHGNSITALLTFWNGEHAKASPGLLLMGTTIDWASAQGIERFDYNATAPWVRYIVDSQKTECNIVVFSPGFRGRILSKIGRIAGKLV